MKSNTRKIAIGICGGIVLLIGLALIVLPGPAFIVIPAGLAILATEFEWAQRWLHNAKAYFRRRKKSASLPLSHDALPL